MNDPAANFIHEINRETYQLNKKIVGTSNSLQQMELETSIYQQPQAQPQAHTVPQQQAPIAQPTVPQQQLQSNIDTDTAKEFIDRLTSVEKKIDRFFNLIERRVVKNAKEINIRIKLNENTDTGQE